MKHLMDHSVDIYKQKKRKGKESYGVPQPDEYYYSNTPDMENVMCRVRRSTSPTIEQGQPFQEVIENYKIYFPIGTEIKENDKVVFNGVEFFLNIPFSFRTHVEVNAWRVRKQ